MVALRKINKFGQMGVEKFRVFVFCFFFNFLEAGRLCLKKLKTKLMIRRLVKSLGVCNRTCARTEHAEPLWWNEVLILCELLKLPEHWLYRRHSEIAAGMD